ncbi:MAG: hypothetical protein U1D30_22365 [Planctomycetota bacterium]
MTTRYPANSFLGKKPFAATAKPSTCEAEIQQLNARRHLNKNWSQDCWRTRAFLDRIVGPTLENSSKGCRSGGAGMYPCCSPRKNWL